jgi:uncharacterized protein YbjT (DUF2867 family)
MTGVDGVFVALDPSGEQGSLQRGVIATATAAKVPQLVRISVLNVRHESAGVNQRAHADLDDAVGGAGLPYTSLRPAIFMTSALEGARRIREGDDWLGTARRGRNPLIDPRDVAATAVAVLLDPGTWGRHYELAGPQLYSWAEVADLIGQELGRTVTFTAVDDDTFRTDAARYGLSEAAVATFLAREHAVAAGDNERVTDWVERLTGAAPRTLPAFLHENRTWFLPRTND